MTFPRSRPAPDTTQLVNPFALHQAILVGLTPELSEVAPSIRRIEKALVEPHGIFSEFDFLVLDDLQRNGNRTMLVHRLNSLAEASKVQSFQSILVLFVGHTRRSPHVQLLLPERLLSHPQQAEERDWLDWDTVLQWFAPIQTHNLLFVLDSPHAKTLHQKNTLQWLFQQQEKEPGQKLFWGSGCRNQTEWAGKHNTFFLESLVDALEGWGARSDHGIISTELLFAFLHQRVHELSYRHTGRHSIPFRLQWPETSTKPWLLTHSKKRHELDDALKDAILEGRCLLWAGEQLSDRAVPTPFPHRSQWEGIQRRVWLEYADFQREPGASSRRMAALGMSILDSGVDSALEQACRQNDYLRWIPQANSSPPATDTNILFRLSGGVGTHEFSYEWEDLDQRFHLMLAFLQQQKSWDSLLIFGFPMDEIVPRRWLEQLLRVLPQCWIVFPQGEEHDKAEVFRQMGVKLIMDEDAVILQRLEALSHLQAVPEHTKPVRLRLLPRPDSSSSSESSRSCPGLRPYSTTQTQAFWGRGVHVGQEETELLDTWRQDIHNHRKLILYGACGAGKTSFLLAGLFPILQELDRFRIFYADSEDPWSTWVTQLQDEPCFLEPPTRTNILERMGYWSVIQRCPVVVCVDHLERIRTPDHSSNPLSLFLQEWYRAVLQLEQLWPSARWHLLVCAESSQFPALTPWIRYGESPASSPVQCRELLPLSFPQAEQLLIRCTRPHTVAATEISAALHKLGWYGPDAPDSILPAQLQMIAFSWQQVREHASKAEYRLSAHLEAWIDWPTCLTSFLQNKILASLPLSTRRSAIDLLLFLVDSSSSRRLRKTAELDSLLSASHTSVSLQQAREHLLTFSVLTTRTEGQEEWIELSHDLWIPAIQSLGRATSQLAQQACTSWQEYQNKERRVLPRPLVQSLQHSVSAWERIPSKHRKELKIWHEESRQHHRKMRVVPYAVSVLLCLGLAGLWWLLRPPSVAHVVQQQIAALLQEPYGEQAKFWLAMHVFQQKSNQATAQQQLTQRLLTTQGEQTCKLLRALYHLTSGNIVTSVQNVTQKKGAFLLHDLRCPAHTLFRKIKLQGAVLTGASWNLVDLQHAQLQGTDLKQAQLQQSQLRGANLQGADLRDASLYGAKLQQANFAEVTAQMADFRQAQLQGIRLDRAHLQGALFTSQQIASLQTSSFVLKDAVCLTGIADSPTLSGRADECYRWHRQKQKTGNSPVGCPTVLEGPIVVFTVLSREGKCPERMLQQISLESAFCPKPGHPACSDGQGCRQKQGDACYRLGQRFETGQGIELDLTTAAALYQRACQAQHLSSCFALGTFFLRGRGVVQDEKQAATYFSQICEKNHGLGCAAFAQLLEKGWGSSQDHTRAFSLYEKACTQKIARGCIGLGHGYESGLLGKIDPDQAETHFRRACLWQDGVGCYHYARRLYAQRRRRKQATGFYSKARPLLEQSCQKDDPESCAMLGILWEKGYVGKRDLSLAVQLLNKACQQNHGLGCNALGLLYFSGKGVEKSYATALALYQKACQRNDGEGCDNAGSMYERGHGISRDYRRAHTFYQQSCQLGHGWGCNDLADLYHLGRGVRRNRSLARQWYRKACQLGVSSACP